jgi:N-acetylglucosaminyl-diphospho-decaprenol L-rhamnosyltransferase
LKSTATVIIPTVGPERAIRLLESLARAGGEFEAIVADNGTDAPELERAAAALPEARVIRIGSNVGYSRAVNRAAREAAGETLVLLNDDCVVEPGYVQRIVEPIDPGSRVAMAAGVMRDARHPGLIETAGIEIDHTLLAFDYLNGEPVEVLQRGVADPLGPSGAAAAFWREAFLDAGGFDEELFAYLEDVDLVLRLRRDGAACRLAKGAIGVHEHSGTLGSGSRRKDYLMGYGRGYLLRKWGVPSPRRLLGIVVREVITCAGQAALDRNIEGVRGRLRGWRAARSREPYPGPEVLPEPPSLGSTLARRWRRRARIRRSSE